MHKYKVLTGLAPGSVISTTKDMGNSSHKFRDLVREGSTIFTFRGTDSTLINMPYEVVERISRTAEREHGPR